MQAILSRFEDRTQAALRAKPATKEWVRKTLRRQGAQRCPARLRRLSVDVILRYGDDLAELFSEYPDDILWIQAYDYSVGYQPPDRKDRINELQIKMESMEWTDEWGTRWGHAVGGVGATTVDYPIKDWSQLDGYLAERIPDPHAPGRLDAALKVLAMHGESKYCAANIHLGLFERMHCLRGMENSFSDLYLYEREVVRLLEALTENLLGLIQEWGKTSVAGIVYSDDWGSQTELMISPDAWRRFFKLHYRRLFDEIHRRGMDVFFHSCGNVMRIIPDLIELGVDVLDPVQPGAMDINQVARDFGGHISFSGAIDDQRLDDYTPQEVQKVVRQAIEALGRPFGNAYLLAPANLVGPRVPFENLRALCEASDQTPAS
jgi:uroporphyrinogen decarboxylase